MPPSEPSAPDRFEQLRVLGDPLITDEVRWFASGSPPRPIVDWFAQGGQAAVVELRRDAYRISSAHDVGLKRRDNGPLELKRRTGVTGPSKFPLGLEGRVEEWHKTGLEEPLTATDWQWSVVDKVVLTRTFVMRDDSFSELESREDGEAACDVELATVTVDDGVAWSFALEAWGAVGMRRHLLDSSLDFFAANLAPPPTGFVEALHLNMGYPEWLASTVWDDQLISP